MNPCGQIMALLLLVLPLGAPSFAGTDSRAVTGDPAGANVSTDQPDDRKGGESEETGKKAEKSEQKESARLTCVANVRHAAFGILGKFGLIVEKREFEDLVKALIKEFGQTGEAKVQAFGPNTIAIGYPNKRFMTGHYYSPRKTIVFHHNLRVISDDCWTVPRYVDELTAADVVKRMTYSLSREVESLPNSSEVTSVYGGRCHAQFTIRTIESFSAPENLCLEYLEFLR